MMKKVVIDTNVWMEISERKFDLFGELGRILDFSGEICVLNGTLLELEKIILEQRGRFKRAAKLALALIKAKGVKVLRSEESSVDEELVRLSQKGDLVLTQDLILKKRLVRPYLTIRQGKTIAVVR